MKKQKYLHRENKLTSTTRCKMKVHHLVHHPSYHRYLSFLCHSWFLSVIKYNVIYKLTTFEHVKKLVERSWAIYTSNITLSDFPCEWESAYNAQNPSSIPGSGSSPGVGNSNSLQYSCLENSMDREVWQATIHQVAKSQTQLSNWPFHFHSKWYILMLKKAC